MSRLLVRLQSLVRTLFWSGRVDREIDEELRFHVEEEIEAGRRAGLSYEEARSAAHASLGGAPARVRDACRDAAGVSFVDDFRQDVAYGARILRRNPGFTAVVLATLGLATGAVVTVFSITDAWLLRPLRFPAADRLVVAFGSTTERPTEPAVWMPYREYVAWKGEARTFTVVSAAFYHAALWRTSTEAASVVGLRVTPEFFETFGVRPLLGRPLTTADSTGPPAVVLSYGFWQRSLGGSTDAVGRTVTLSDEPYTVVGIMPRAFDMRLLDRPEGAAFWTLFKPGAPGYDPDGLGPVAIVGRLHNGVSIAAARAEAESITQRTESRYPLNFTQFVVNLSSLQADNTRTIRSTLMTVLAAVVCLLLIAAMNVGTLLLGRGLGRSGEAAVRVALGAGRARLLRQSLTETLLVAVGGGVLGLGLAVIAMRLFLSWNPLGTLPANSVQLNGSALAVAMLAVFVTTMICGVVPAVRTSAGHPADALRGGGERGRTVVPTQRAQSAMLVAQIAVSAVLLVCTSLLAKTFAHLRSEPLGFNPAGLSVATVVLPNTPFDSGAARITFYRQLADRVRALPGVRAVAAGTSRPLVGGAPLTVNTTAEDAVSAPRFSAQDVTTEFFETLQIPVVLGRAFDRRDDARGAPVVVLNARAAKDLFGDPAAALGQRVRLDGESWRQVVGVVGNVRTSFFNTLEWQTNPIVYRPADQAFSRVGDPAATSFSFDLHIRADRSVTDADVRAATLAAGPRAAVIEFRRVPDLVAEATRQPTFRMTLLLWFGAVSLLLAAIGVYGVVSQAVSLRLREIAIRLALGAEPLALVAALARHAIVVASAGLAIGAAAALMLGQTLQSLLYGVRARDAASLAGAGVLLLAVTIVAASLPAIRAIRRDPVGLLHET